MPQFPHLRSCSAHALVHSSRVDVPSVQGTPGTGSLPCWAHSTPLAILEQRGKLKGGSLGWWAFLEASSRDLVTYRGQQWEELSFCSSWRRWLQGELERLGISVSSSPNLGETCEQFLYLSSFLCLSSPRWT